MQGGRQLGRLAASTLAWSQSLNNLVRQSFTQPVGRWVTGWISESISLTYSKSLISVINEAFWQVDAMNSWILQICTFFQPAFSGFLMKIFRLLIHIWKLNKFLSPFYKRHVFFTNGSIPPSGHIVVLSFLESLAL